MSELCKHQVKDNEKSTFNNAVFRSCKLKAKRDGYCELHHPENIAYAIESQARNELIDELRAAEKREEALVGSLMRMRRKEEFDAILAEIRDAQSLMEQLRRERGFQG